MQSRAETIGSFFTCPCVEINFGATSPLVIGPLRTWTACPSSNIRAEYRAWSIRMPTCGTQRSPSFYQDVHLYACACRLFLLEQAVTSCIRCVCDSLSASQKRFFRNSCACNGMDCAKDRASLRNDCLTLALALSKCRCARSCFFAA